MVGLYTSFLVVAFVAQALAISNNPAEDATLKTNELIAKYGYPVETHSVLTSDGYILEVHRIPYGRLPSAPTALGPPVLVQHGLFCSSADWVNMGPGSSLGYLLADEGYDVWLGNGRGNRYSRRHAALNPDSGSDFWNYSWHEIGYADIAAMAEYIIRNTRYNDVHFIGHSQGTTSLLVLLTTRPEYNALFRSINLMAPIAYVTDQDNPLASFTWVLNILAYILEPQEVFPTLNAVQGVVDNYCGITSPWAPFCNFLLTSVGGQTNLNSTMLPVILAHAPAGASTKQLSHFAQLISSQQFRWYDYGSIGNLLNYGSLNPPSYNLRVAIKPINLFFSAGDTRVAASDVWRLYNELPFSPEPYLIGDLGFSHLDYVWGLNAKEQIWDVIIRRMRIADSPI